MSRCRVWYHLDGKISVSYPDLRKDRQPEGMTTDEWIDYQLEQVPIKAPQFAGLDFEDKEVSELPQDRADRDRWRGTKTTGIKINTNIVLREDLFKQIDEELDKSSPSIIMLERLRRKIEKEEHD